ncbi:unnamed protein product, partial [Gongylonema pulchrum]|uniref:Si:ch73-389k6.1 n=1 Tax=Gongylonema pulchrum TaxID=637853 RepID=A0A183DLF7_9BILA
MTEAKTRSLERPRRLVQPNVNIRRCKSLLRGTANLQPESQLTETSEADAYRPSGNLSSTGTITRSQLTIKPQRLYQLRNENPNSSEKSSRLPGSIPGISHLPTSSSSVPLVHETAVPSSGIHKTISVTGEFKQNSAILTTNKTNSGAKKLLRGVNSNPFLVSTTRPLLCESRNSPCAVAVPTTMPLRAIQAVVRDNDSIITKAKEPSSPYRCASIPEKANVDIDWEVPKPGFKSRFVTVPTSEAPAIPVPKAARPRRSTVACLATTDYLSAEDRWNPLLTVEKTCRFPKSPCSSIPNGSSSLKRKIAKELPKKSWFSSSVDGPPVELQTANSCCPVRETAIDDDLPSTKQSLYCTS